MNSGVGVHSSYLRNRALQQQAYISIYQVGMLVA